MKEPTSTNAMSARRLLQLILRIAHALLAWLGAWVILGIPLVIFGPSLPDSAEIPCMVTLHLAALYAAVLGFRHPKPPRDEPRGFDVIVKQDERHER